MAASYGPQANPGSFVATTNIWDVSQVYSVEVTSPEFKELIVRLGQNINNISLSVDTRDAGYYAQTEFVNGQIFFPNPARSSTTATAPIWRQVFRLVINFGTLPNTATKSVAHNLTITSGYSFTRIYATASDQIGMSYIPIPYASPVLTKNIELNVDSTNVNITTGSDRTNYTVTYVILEYIKE